MKSTFGSKYLDDIATNHREEIALFFLLQKNTYKQIFRITEYNISLQFMDADFVIELID